VIPHEPGLQRDDSPRILLSRWHSADVLGLPRTEPTLASRWRKSRAPFAATMVGGLIVQSSVEAGRYGLRYVPIVALFWLVVVWWLLSRERRRNRVLQDFSQIGISEDPLVSVRLQMDAHDYGHDLGRLHVTQDCLYFDGEQMTFTLRPCDFSHEEISFSLYSEQAHILRVRETNERVSIHITAAGASKAQLEKLLASPNRAGSDPTVAAVLPPLEPGPDRFAATPASGTSLGIGGCFAIGFALISSVWMIATSNYQVVVLCMISSVCFGLIGLGAHRLWVRRDRARALRDLGSRREQISARYGA